MFQVKLKINHLKLHIIQPLLIELAIRNKQGTKITIPSLFPLFQGKSEINTDYQFLTSSKNLQLCVILFKNYQRKYAGMVQLDLSRMKANQQVQMCESLKDSKDEHAQISLILSYKKSRESFRSINLISTKDIQMMKIVKQQSNNEYRLRQAKQKNQQIQKQYSYLSRLNRQLYQQLQNREMEHSRVQSSWDAEIHLQQQELNSLINKLERQKIIIASIIDIALATGDPILVDNVENILGIRQKSEQSQNTSQQK